MDGEDWDEFPELDPVEFRLANGNKVRVVFGNFWTKIAPFDFIHGYMPSQFYGVRIYSNESTFSERYTLQYELRAPHDFFMEVSPLACEWIDEMVHSRRMMDFDSIEDFVTAFAEELTILYAIVNDAVQYYNNGTFEESADQDEFYDTSPGESLTNENGK